MSKNYRIRDEEVELIQRKMIKLIVESQKNIKENDILHCLVNKYIGEISVKDVLEYREKNLGKED
jgi:deoxyhypusine synthase